MVAIDMCGKGPITGEWIYEIAWKHVLPFMFFLFSYLFAWLFNNIFTFLYLQCLIFWKWSRLCMFLKYFTYSIIYFVKICFWGTALIGCFIILSTLFILILHGRKVRGWIFDKYLVLYQLFIKHQFYVGNVERFPS